MPGQRPWPRSGSESGVAQQVQRDVAAVGRGKRVKGPPDELAELVRLSGRFKGYADGWSDAAVRRYARDAGPLLGRLNALVRSDCTTRNRAKAEALQESIDDLERRIAELAEEDRRNAERPQIDGDAVMAHLGIGPGREIGQIMRWLLELKRSEGELPEAELLARLEAYHAELVG